MICSTGILLFRILLKDRNTSDNLLKIFGTQHETSTPDTVLNKISGSLTRIFGVIIL